MVGGNTAARTTGRSNDYEVHNVALCLPIIVFMHVSKGAKRGGLLCRICVNRSAKSVRLEKNNMKWTAQEHLGGIDADAEIYRVRSGHDCKPICLRMQKTWQPLHLSLVENLWARRS